MSADTPPPQPAPAPRRLVGVGLGLAVAISLAATCYPVFSPAIQAYYATEPDANNIAGAAATVTWGEAAGWWTGAWIEPGMPYYRPLPSLLFWAEYRLFGRDFQKYSVVSWLAHAGCSALLFLLALSVLRDRPAKVAVALGLLAVLLFNTRRNILMPGMWEPYPIAWSLMPYWPSQTDIFSLLFSLLSLLALDRYAQAPTRRGLAGAVGLFAVALLCKEMTVAMALLAPLWVWYRRRKIPWEVVGLYVGLGIIFLLVRRHFVPGAWGPEPPVPMTFGRKLLFYLNDELFLKYGSGILWPIPAAWGILALAWALRRWQRSLIWLLPGGLVWTLLTCQLFGSNFTAFTLPDEAWPLGLSLLAWGGLAVLLQSRSRLNWTLAAMVAVVHLPIMHVIGPHYQYWPAAFWSLLSAALLLSAADWWKALGKAPRKADAPESGAG